MKKNQFIGILILGFAITVFGSCNKSNSDKGEKSISAINESVEDCLKDFDFLVEKIQTNYPGYNDKVTNENRSQLTNLEKEVRQKITNYPDSCIYYLNEYTKFFKDGHLGVRRIWSDTTENRQKLEVMGISTYGKNLYVNVDSLYQATKDAEGIEGVWCAYQREFIVTKDGKKYVGVVVNQKDWKNGQVIFEFKPVNDSIFDVINYSLIKDEKTFKTKASLLLNGKLIEFQNDRIFVRKSDSPIFDEALRTSYENYYPNVSFVAMALDDSTFFLRIPTFAENTANELITKHWEEIMTRPNLIIDIRYNGGGNDGAYRELARLIYTKPYDVTGVEYYATEDNIKYFEDFIKKEEIPKEWIKRNQILVEAMKKNKGKFVTHPWSIGNNTVRMNTVYPMPRNVGIIINERNASSAEQFLLAAKESDKVILFGNTHTAGVLDYSNVRIIPFPSNKYQVGCPLTRSKRIPDNPFDNIGIAPDVIIPLPATKRLYDKLDEWVYFVKNYLGLLNEEKKIL
ncbi:MAG: hypothetical protein LBE91_03880 [Tannerella sp.]|jgi:hypothetical protein|nr:hypothetical protein [Tannerella sp.]